MKKRDEQSALRGLRWKRDLKIKGKVIYVISGKNPKFPRRGDIGNKSWGAIDYLVKQCGYRQYFVHEFIRDDFNRNKKRGR